MRKKYKSIILFFCLCILASESFVHEVGSTPLNKTVCFLLEKHSVNEVARYLIKKKEEGRGANEVLRLQLFDGDLIVIGLHDGIVPSLVGQKNYYNAHQLKNLHPDDTYAERIKSENSLVQADLNCESEKELRVRPKYAYYIPSQEKTELRTKITEEYGNVLAVLKQNVFERTTFTLSDSMDLRNKRNVFTFYSKLNRSVRRQKGGTYLEAQVWGDITLGDIAYFLVDCPFFSKKVSARNLKILIGTNTPVYQCLSDKSQTKLRKGRRLDG